MKYFEGTPIPTSVILVGILAIAPWHQVAFTRPSGSAASASARQSCTLLSLLLRRERQRDDQRNTENSKALIFAQAEAWAYVQSLRLFDPSTLRLFDP